MAHHGCGKRWAIVIMATAMGVGPATAWAQAVGSPASILEKGQWVMGLGAMAHPGRSLHGTGKLEDFGGGHYRGYGLTNWLSVYGELGAAYVQINDSSIVKTSDPSSVNKFGANIYTSFALKTKLFERQGWELDSSAQYTDIRARHKNKNQLRMHDWQFAGTVAKSLGRLKPYAGAKISLVGINAHVRQGGSLLAQKTYQQDTPLGPFVGTDLYLGEQRDVILNVEAAYVGGVELDCALAYVF